MDSLKPQLPKISNDDSESSKPKKGPERSKTEHLKIDATIDIQPDKIPAGSTFKGYREVVIQNIVFKTFNICYRLSQYQTADGSYVSGQLSDGLNGGHFGNDPSVLSAINIITNMSPNHCF